MSAHWKFERKQREQLIRCIGQGKVIEEFYVDRGHPNGAELHRLTDTGVVLIYNALTWKLITKIIARPYQIERYYRRENRSAPMWLIRQAENYDEFVFHVK